MSQVWCCRSTVGPVPKEGRYQDALLTSLTRIIGQWTAPDFLTGVVAREGVELDSGAITTITLLSADGPQRPSLLAHHMVTGASNISKIVARLTAAGLAERIPDPADARAQLIKLTPAGKRVADTFVRAGDGLVDDLLTGWSEQDRDDLVRLLQKLEKSTINFSDHLRTTHSTPASQGTGEIKGAMQ